MPVPTFLEAITLWIFYCGEFFCQAWRLQDLTGVHYRNCNLPLQLAGLRGVATGIRKVQLASSVLRNAQNMWYNESQAHFLLPKKPSKQVSSLLQKRSQLNVTRGRNEPGRDCCYQSQQTAGRNRPCFALVFLPTFCLTVLIPSSWTRNCITKVQNEKSWQ